MEYSKCDSQIFSDAAVDVIFNYSGLFACISDEQAGYYLSTFDDYLYNSKKLIYVMENPVDGTAAACTLKVLSIVLKLH